MRFVAFAFLCLVSIVSLHAQDVPCRDVRISNSSLPTYAPIALAAHIQGAVRFKVTLSADAVASVNLIDGPRFLVGTATTYIEGRRYHWATGNEHTPCSFTATVEYRIITPESDEVNNFLRVTVLGINRTLVEVQPIKPSCNDCSNDNCPLEGMTESKSITYPAMARAARVEGDVSARVAFDGKGEVTAIDQWVGPEMLKQSTEDYLQSWRLKSLPSYQDSCHMTVLIEYKLTAATEVVSSDVHIFKADPTHILVEDHPVLIVDPASQTPTHKTKRFGLF
ncbi:energy transducer TonB [Tunturiibacter lichenicola]|uniref:energy transducer TonB n=1 Tax=Tunturiibacter lichenicola TaxID=2051959 RepID=UPI003D9BD00D